MSPQRGFTLIELVMVIAIMGTVAVGISSFVGSTVGGYVDTAQRQRMATAMVVASDKMSRELRHALPNSVRIGGATNNCIEFVPVIRGGYYESVPLASPAATFDAISLGNAAPLTGHIAVYPVDQTDVYSPSDAVPATVTAALASVPVGVNQVTVTLGANHQFLDDSGVSRFYLVDTPRAFCQPVGSDRIYRYTGYGFNAAAVLPPAGGARQVLVNEIAGLTFEFANATRERNAVVRFDLAATVGGESLSLDQEVQVRNVP